MLHHRFFQAAALCAGSGTVMALAASLGERISGGQIGLAAAAAAALAVCGVWYRGDARRGLGEVAQGHVALAMPGAVAVLLGGVGLAAGFKTAAPAVLIGAVTVAVAFLMLLKRANAATPSVRRAVTVQAGDAGASVVTVDYSVQFGR